MLSIEIRSKYHSILLVLLCILFIYFLVRFFADIYLFIFSPSVAAIMIEAKNLIFPKGLIKLPLH